MIAHCGLDCDICPTMIATKTNDAMLRRQTAEKWSAQYGAEIAAEDISCDGCNSISGKLFKHCSVCEIRSCSTGKGNVTCANCDQYPCTKLDLIFTNEPSAKLKLDSILMEGK